MASARSTLSKLKPYQLKCNRLNQCGYEEKTRDRYRHLFENLSDRFPSTPENPNATADGSYAATVRFPLCDGYWERIIDAAAVAANKGDKAGIRKGMKYKGQGWEPKGQAYEKDDQVFVVEGIFHAIALWLAGYKAIAAISCNNFPWQIIEANQGKGVRWVIALDDDTAARSYPMHRGESFDSSWFADFKSVFGHNGLASLA